jgi:hypothetical protein
MKSACFVKESTKVVTQSKPLTCGKHVIKSILISSQGRVDFGKGKKRAKGFGGGNFSLTCVASLAKVCNAFSHTRPPKHL